MTRSRMLLFAMLTFVVAWAQAQQAYIVDAQGRRVNVEKILARPDGSLVVTVNGQPRNLARDQYQQAVGVKPDGLDAAVAQIMSGDYEGAAPVLQEIMRKSAYQSWDTFAGRALIEGALATDRAPDAKRTLDQLSKRYGDSLIAVYPEVEVLQWKTRIATGDTTGLEADLTKVIREDPNRLRRGMAQVARGDMKRRGKDFQAAVLDYLRAVYFYQDVDAIHAEALYKTAATFADIGDTGRLRKYQQELKQTYPDSPYAAMPLGN